MLRNRFIWSAILFVMLTVGINAQRGQRQRPEGGGPSQRFEKTAPAIGEELLDVTLYDPAGQPVNLREKLEGKYTVLILGCLT